MNASIDYFGEKLFFELKIPRCLHYSIYDIEDIKTKDIMSHLYLEPALCYPLQKLLVTDSDTGRIKKNIYLWLKICIKTGTMM